MPRFGGRTNDPVARSEENRPPEDFELHGQGPLTGKTEPSTEPLEHVEDLAENAEPGDDDSPDFEVHGFPQR